MRHILFFSAVLLLIAIVFLASPTASDSPTDHSLVGHASAEAIVCCTFLHEGEERTCAAVIGQTCDVCAAFCG